MKTIIKKAIEGGYTPYRYGFRFDNFNKDSSAFLDPLLWQALGKACGWNSWAIENKKHIMYDTGFIKDCTVCNSLKFHEINLTEGWDKAVKYLEDLIK